MKGNAKKVAVFISVVAIAMFIAIPMASASGYDSWWKMLILGEYAFTGSGACTSAPGGFKDDFTPTDATVAGPMGPNFWEGFYWFHYNGTGKMETQQCYQDGYPTYAAGCALLSWEFEYEMDGAEITFTLIPGTYYLKYIKGAMAGKGFDVPVGNTVEFKPWTGRISPDGRHLFVFYGGPFKFDLPGPPGPPFYGVVGVICNGVHQGFKTH